MNMRTQFAQTAMRLLEFDERVVILLGDIGAFGFRDAFQRFPQRVYNLGILEQAMVGFAAGLAKAGFIPIIHTIAPFLTERCLEQIKIDFGYQHLGGNFITVGASYDYAALGATHHCPGDIQVITSIPNVDVMVPGTATEFSSLLESRYDSGRTSYFRLSEGENLETRGSSWAKAEVIREGQQATVVAVGPLLDAALVGAEGLDVTVLYYSTVSPFDGEMLRKHAPTGRILLCEPYYQGGLSAQIAEALWPKPILLRSIGVPREFLMNYGSKAQHDVAVGLTPDAIRKNLEELLNV
jgi:transketolase